MLVKRDDDQTDKSRQDRTGQGGSILWSRDLFLGDSETVASMVPCTRSNGHGPGGGCLVLSVKFIDRRRQIERKQTNRRAG